jgi:Concanavalin A-like lectin/glucanases superfamily
VRSRSSFVVGVACAAGLAFAAFAACTSFDSSEGSDVPTSDAAATPDAGGAEASSSALHPYVQAVLADAPIGYFRFEEALTALNAKSEIAGGTAGTLQGDATRSAEGVLPNTQALVLGGDGQVAVAGSFSFEANEPYTMEAWIRSRPPKPSDGQYRMVFQKQLLGGDGGSEQWDLQNVYVRNENVAFERYVEGQPLVVGGPIVTNQWVHIAAVYDGATAYIYIDGAMVESKSDVRKAAAKVQPFSIGGAQGALRFIGLIDEAAIYDKALSAERIEAHRASAGLGP